MLYVVASFAAEYPQGTRTPVVPPALPGPVLTVFGAGEKGTSVGVVVKLEGLTV